MKDFWKQFTGLFGAGVAAACCLGFPIVLSTLGTLGLGFLIHDTYLFPIFTAFIVVSLWLLYRSARGHANLVPFWLGLGGGLFGAAGLWLLVTGLYPMSWSVYTGLAVLVAGSVWDFVNGKRAPACEVVCEPTKVTPKEAAEQVDLGKRATTGVTLSIAAAAAFYGIYKSVDALAPTAQAGEIACWGINSCKGTTACTTAFNACNGQNQCKARGYLNIPEKECYIRGGVALEGSEADPAKK